jgi:hypothetical protein
MDPQHCLTCVCSVDMAVEVLGVAQQLNALQHAALQVIDFRFFQFPRRPYSLSISLEPFRIFSKIRGDIYSSRYTTGAVDTGGKSSLRKVLNIFLSPILCNCFSGTTRTFCMMSKPPSQIE